jgi:uncharacterized protein YbjT (DUF2867 family)
VAVILVVAIAMAEVVVMVAATAVDMAEAEMAGAGRVALVAGATGLVGRAVLAALLADKRYRIVHTVGRRAPDVRHAKLVHHTVDFGSAKQLAALPAADEVFIALGTTIKVAGSQAAFRAVDFDAIVALARATQAQGATKFGVVSAMGADAKSPIFYNRVKGEMEDALAGMGLVHLVIARPSMLAGDRASLHQATRAGEQMGLVFSKLLKPLIPNNYRAVAASDVAAALVHALQTAAPGTLRLLSGALQGAAQRA